VTGAFDPRFMSDRGEEVSTMIGSLSLRAAAVLIAMAAAGLMAAVTCPHYW
jgi:hypothetical protein